MRELVIARLPGPGISTASDAPENVWPAPFPETETGESFRSAAVLVPLIDHADGMTVLFTKRTATLPKHGGQISFPGGTVSAGEIEPEVTALRETEEEIGIPAAAIELIGRLTVRDTSTGFWVMPVVGILTPPLTIIEDPSEVAGVFEVPLAFVCDAANHRIDRRLVRGEEREFRAMPFGDHYIWGLTARILFELSQLLEDE
jgi:8-oxo-dGTP pyrophosphatase MutT (NUDIX family)